jgi:hypothetical protein
LKPCRNPESKSATTQKKKHVVTFFALDANPETFQATTRDLPESFSGRSIFAGRTLLVGWLFSGAGFFSFRDFFEIWDDCEMPTSGSDSSSLSIFRLEEVRDGAGMLLGSE